MPNVVRVQELSRPRENARHPPEDAQDRLNMACTGTKLAHKYPLSEMTWTINNNLGPESRSGVDAGGWLWEIERDGEARRVLVEITGAALAVDQTELPSDTREAI